MGLKTYNKKYYIRAANPTSELKDIIIDGMTITFLGDIVKDDGKQFTKDELLVLKLKGLRFIRNGIRYEPTVRD